VGKELGGPRSVNEFFGDSSLFCHSNYCNHPKAMFVFSRSVKDTAPV
jgi:hypothetical protein